MKEVQESKTSQVEVFLNSVPLLASLSREEKLKLASVLEEQTFMPEERVVNEVRNAGVASYFWQVLHYHPHDETCCRVMWGISFTSSRRARLLSHKSLQRATSE